MCKSFFHPDDKDGEDYMAINQGAMLLCECCVGTIVGAARTMGMGPFIRDRDPEGHVQVLPEPERRS